MNCFHLHSPYFILNEIPFKNLSTWLANHTERAVPNKSWCIGHVLFACVCVCVWPLEPMVFFLYIHICIGYKCLTLLSFYWILYTLLLQVATLSLSLSHSLPLVFTKWHFSDISNTQQWGLKDGTYTKASTQRPSTTNQNRKTISAYFVHLTQTHRLSTWQQEEKIQYKVLCVQCEFLSKNMTNTFATRFNFLLFLSVC